MIERKEVPFERTGDDPGPINRVERFDLAPDPHVLTNLNFQIRKVNIAGLHLFGQTLAFLERIPLFQFISLCDRHAVFELSRASLSGVAKGVESIEIRVLPPRRTEIVCTAKVTLMRDRAGAPIGFLWQMQTQPCQMPSEQTWDLSQRGDELSDLVHEFRNILTAIQINAEIIGLSRSSRDRRESLQEIRKGCEKAASVLGQFRAFKSDEGVEVRRWVGD